MPRLISLSLVRRGRLQNGPLIPELPECPIEKPGWLLRSFPVMAAHFRKRAEGSAFRARGIFRIVKG